MLNAPTVPMLAASHTNGAINMSLFMDIHNRIDGLTAEAVAGAHQRDLEVQDSHGVQHLKYWFDETSGKVFCLVDAPNAEAAAAVHREAHGLVADEVTEVREGA
jgi:Protein of unknown function (DUF4242)